MTIDYRQHAIPQPQPSLFQWVQLFDPSVVLIVTLTWWQILVVIDGHLGWKLWRSRKGYNQINLNKHSPPRISQSKKVVRWSWASCLNLRHMRLALSQPKVYLVKQLAQISIGGHAANPRTDNGCRDVEVTCNQNCYSQTQTTITSNPGVGMIPSNIPYSHLCKCTVIHLIISSISSWMHRHQQPDCMKEFI